MWSWHWSPLTQTSLVFSSSDGLASFLKTTLANGVKVVKKAITSKFRFHLIATYALGCFRNFSCIPVPKLPWRAPTPVRLVKEWILMLLKKTINLKTVYILISDVFFFIKKCHNIFGPPLCHLGQWLIFYWPRKKNLGQPKAGSHFRHWSCSSVNFFWLCKYLTNFDNKKSAFKNLPPRNHWSEWQHIGFDWSFIIDALLKIVSNIQPCP